MSKNKFEDFPPFKGGTKKIGEPPQPPCAHPEHNPPSMMVFEPGTYEHTCPACGKKKVFTVSPVYI